ncbi:MAG: cation diffusion facilitator family transporter [Holosporales bacterium]
MTQAQSPNRARLVRLASYASVSVAVILIAAKFIAYMMTNALSLQATLMDSLLDAAASIINLIAIHHAHRPADEEHRFGHGKIEAIAALGQSVFIAGSSGWLLFEALHRFSHPEPTESVAVGIAVMILAIILTAALILFQNYVIRTTHSTAIKADAAHYRSDLMINISVIIALVASDQLNLPYLDPLLGSAIAAYILWTAWSIASEAFHLLIDRELADDKREQIVMLVRSHPEVRGIHDLRTRSSGSHAFIQLHVEMDADMSLSRAHDIAEEITILIRNHFPHSEVLIHQDPYLGEDKHDEGILS